LRDLTGAPIVSYKTRDKDRENLISFDLLNSATEKNWLITACAPSNLGEDRDKGISECHAYSII